MSRNNRKASETTNKKEIKTLINTNSEYCIQIFEKIKIIEDYSNASSFELIFKDKSDTPIGIKFYFTQWVEHENIKKSRKRRYNALLKLLETLPSVKKDLSIENQTNEKNIAKKNDKKSLLINKDQLLGDTNIGTTTVMFHSANSFAKYIAKNINALCKVELNKTKKAKISQYRFTKLYGTKISRSDKDYLSKIFILMSHKEELLYANPQKRQAYHPQKETYKEKTRFVLQIKFSAAEEIVRILNKTAYKKSTDNEESYLNTILKKLNENACSCSLKLKSNGITFELNKEARKELPELLEKINCKIKVNFIKHSISARKSSLFSSSGNILNSKIFFSFDEINEIISKFDVATINQEKSVLEYFGILKDLKTKQETDYDKSSIPEQINNLFGK